MTPAAHWLDALKQAGAWVPPQSVQGVCEVVGRIQADAAQVRTIRLPAAVANQASLHPNDCRKVTALLKITETSAVVWSPAWHNGKRWFHRPGCVLLKWIDRVPSEEEMQREIESAWFGKLARQPE
jgi:hypothetical protein